MTDSREFNASTVEEAVAKAAESLGSPEVDLDYEVLDSGSEGFLGIGARDARIVVSFEGVDPAEPAPSVNPSASEDDGSESDIPDSRAEAENVSTTDTDHAASAEEADERDVVEAPADLIDETQAHVSSVIEAMGIDARIDAYDTDDYIAIDIASDRTALIIGQKGETIDSLQYLINSAIYRDRDFVKRIVLDSEGYRQRRIEAIQGMAHRTARKSIREHRDIQMPPMNSSERRIVHVYLKETPGVTTFSEGTGNERRVTVAPE